MGKGSIDATMARHAKVVPRATVAQGALAQHAIETAIRIVIIIMKWDSNMKSVIPVGAIQAAGNAHKIPHDFRRTAVRNLERSGIPRAVAMKLVGHKTESIYRRYAIVAKQDLMDGLKRLAGYQAELERNRDDRKVVDITEVQK